MQYCKNCGRQLKEGARFCDRCGHSVRKTKENDKESKLREIEELKTERLNRKKRLAEKEAKQNESKKRRKSGSGVFIFIFVIILTAVVSVIIGYNIFPSGSDMSKTEETASPASASPMAAVATPEATSPSSEKYLTVDAGSMTVPYPSGFHTNTTSGNEVLNITDSLGGANMIVAKEAKDGEMTDFIKDYIVEIGATEQPDMHAGNDWYSVTAVVGDKVYHRKSVVRNGLAVYYDFIYDTSSTASKKYEEYINYIDSKLK